MENLCRFCMKNRTEKLKICSGNITAMLKVFPDIKISDDDELPQEICYPCSEELKSVYKFYYTIKSTQEIFSQMHGKPENNLKKLSFSPKRNYHPLILPKPHHIEYQCKECKLTFPDKEAFEMHMRNSHRKKRTYKCFECPLVMFNTARQYSVHVRTEHRLDNVCELCNCFFENSSTLKKHRDIIHQDMKFLCKICPLKMSSRRTLYYHLKQSHGINGFIYFCYNCNMKEFATKSLLSKHMEVMHPQIDSKNIYQPEIGFESNEDTYTNEEFLDEFFLNEVNNFNFTESWSNFCYLPFETTDSYKNNKDNDEKNIEFDLIVKYKCPKCEKGFHTSSSLIQHMAHEHNELTLVCTDCGMKFNRVENLKTHKDESHLLPLLNDTVENTPNLDKFIVKLDNGDKKQMQFECNTCSKRFKTKLGFKYHLKTHLNRKDYSCPYCKKSFIHSINLNKHLKTIHAEVKPHVCNLCDRTFATLDHLKKHVVGAHQKTRNFMCSKCGKSYTQSSHLKQHELSHENN